MRKQLLLLLIVVCSLCSTAQYKTYTTPDKVYGILFKDVQLQHVFEDDKTFADCTPKRSPASIRVDYERIKRATPSSFSLHDFVLQNFYLPDSIAVTAGSEARENIVAHIQHLWKVLQRDPDSAITGSSLLALPYHYIVPGGRFREIYYWDSYFTMLGLQESHEYTLMEDMVNNFAYLITTYGHIPNGNRTYYLSRSQPPFFSLMVDLLAKQKGNVVYATYQKALQDEYDYWMDKTGTTQHVVKMPNGSILNRFYDADDQPRQEGYSIDYNLAEKLPHTAFDTALYRNLRTGAETGWDFSTRWFADNRNIITIQTTNLIPVDLNGLLYHLELTLATSYQQTGNLAKASRFRQLALQRKKAINTYCWNAAKHWYYDYNITERKQSSQPTLAGITPLFFSIAPPSHTALIAAVLQQRFLKDGGLVTTLITSGQQWDAPNGWAPLQWMAIKGLINYHQTTLAHEITKRWITLNVHTYQQTGKLMEKYNVVDIHQKAGGGEYPGQDGFGWTNGVLLKLISLYGANP
ncbi:alpha,alpha-trehalase [Russula earlei]|uniref:Alpha,alpha-trehalase n=1 Tax=Russula earlei TaxID=71964 RepID=A0ACC0TSC4_9AGAM|nr:alpha,alpha-trehalase [Russula earlei]